MLNCYPYEVDRESLPSTRSTMSEPIQGTKLLYTPDSRPPSNRSDHRGHHDTRPNNRATNYDSSSVLDVLRLQRQQEKRKVPLGIAGKWKWNTSTPPDTNGNFEINGNTKRVLDGFNATTKSERVKKMQEVYLPQQLRLDEHSDSHHGSGGEIAPGGSTVQQQTQPSLKVSLSPIRVRPEPSSPYVPPRTPVVQDKDLTDEDYAAVSKYFKGRALSPPHQRSTRTIPSPAPSRQSQLELEASPLRASGDTVPSHPYTDSRNYRNTSHQQSHSQSSAPHIAPLASSGGGSTPKSTLRVGDGLSSPGTRYAGGRGHFSGGGDKEDADMSLCAPPSPDGLLNWSAGLNADLIDSMF